MSDPWFRDTCEPFKPFDCAIGTRFIDPCSCQSYYQCDTGYTVIHRNCSSGLWWNHIENGCRAFELVHLNEICIQNQPWKSCNVSENRLTELAIKCGGTHVPDTTQTPVTTNPWFQDTCEPFRRSDCAIGTGFTDPCSCQSYYQCDTGYTVIHRNCSSGLWWNHIENGCREQNLVHLNEICIQDQPWKSCYVSENRLTDLAIKCGGTHVPETTQSPVTTNSLFQDTCEPFRRSDCVTGTRFTDPCSCQSYYQCDTGYTVIHRNCSSGLWWNHIENDCREQNTVYSDEICIQDQPWKSCNVSENRLTELTIKCGGTHVPDTTQPPVTTNPLFQDLCEPQDPTDCPDGTDFIDPCACDSYYTCGQQSTINLSKCPDGTLWHHIDRKCVNNDVITKDTICSKLRPWNRCEVSGSRLAVVAKKCGYKNVSSPPEDNMSVIVGAVVGILLVLLIVIGGLVFWKKRKTLKSKKYGERPGRNPEYFENKDSVHSTINDNRPVIKMDTTHDGYTTPNEMAAPNPHFRSGQQKIESEAVTYENLGPKQSQLRIESRNPTGNDEPYTIPLRNTSEDTPHIYLQLSGTNRRDGNRDTDTTTYANL